MNEKLNKENRAGNIQALKNDLKLADRALRSEKEKDVYKRQMLQSAGTSYAVANAREEVLAAATDICAPYWENGVLQILKEMCIRDRLWNTIAVSLLLGVSSLIASSPR